MRCDGQHFWDRDCDQLVSWYGNMDSINKFLDDTERDVVK